MELKEYIKAVMENVEDGRTISFDVGVLPDARKIVINQSSLNRLRFDVRKEYRATTDLGYKSL